MTPALAAIAAALLWAAGYVIACALWLFTACSRCRGTGKHHSPSGRAWRNCRRCKGTGARLRFGRRAWIYLRRTQTRVND